MPLMKYRISVTLEFLREMKHLSKRYKSLKEDLRNFGNDLLLNPEQGVSLGNNLRKIRIAITSKNKGKSGGARVITYTIIWTEIDTEIKLLTIYDKSERANITDKEIEDILKQNGILYDIKRNRPVSRLRDNRTISFIRLRLCEQVSFVSKFIH